MLDISTHSRAKAAGRDNPCSGRNHVISTHSRAKAAGISAPEAIPIAQISTHSRAKAAGVENVPVAASKIISTHSRAKAAGIHGQCPQCNMYISTHSRAKAAGLHVDRERRHTGFQLTAARRRLVQLLSTLVLFTHHFNSQPREGGWSKEVSKSRLDTISTHSRAKAAGVSLKQVYARKTISTHSRAKAAGKATR